MIIVSVPPALSFQSKTRSLLRGALPGRTETLIDFFAVDALNLSQARSARAADPSTGLNHFLAVL